jgi:hypothetical protein
MVVSKCMVRTLMTAAVRGQGKTRGVFGFALNFFAPLFSFKRKKWKTYNKRKATISLTVMLRQAQHDKEREALQTAINLMNKTYYEGLKKFTTEQADAGSSPA